MLTREWLADSLLITYQLQANEPAVANLQDGQRVLLHEPGEMDVEAEANFDAERDLWIFHPDWTTERILYRKVGYGAWRIIVNGELIGEVEAPRTYEAMGMTSGPFTPYRAYETVQPIFRLFTTTDNRQQYYRERDALNLSVVTHDGCAVPTNWVHIIDYSEEMDGEDAYHIEINMDYWVFRDDQYWTNAAP